jgi:hypothetical protein
MAEAEKKKLTIQIPEGVDVDIESVPSDFDDQAAPVVRVETPPEGYSRGYRWNAAGCPAGEQSS